MQVRRFGQPIIAARNAGSRACVSNGSPGRIRTAGQTINSRLLYR
jgi:hypothetical protein